MAASRSHSGIRRERGSCRNVNVDSSRWTVMVALDWARNLCMPKVYIPIYEFRDIHKCLMDNKIPLHCIL